MSPDIKVGLVLMGIYVVVALVGLGLERWRPMPEEKGNHE